MHTLNLKIVIESMEITVVKVQTMIKIKYQQWQQIYTNSKHIRPKGNENDHHSRFCRFVMRFG